jgi:curved DNA-binding protein CbpA
MKSIDDLDYYELLEISPNASASEIDRAYRLAQQTYGEGSLALYSVFESLDAAAIRGRLDEAYQTLSDPESRGAYDYKFEFHQLSSQSTSTSDSTFEGNARQDDVTTSRSSSSVTDESALEAFDEIVEEYDALEEDGGGDYDGVRLRRTRLFRGYEIEDISDLTKVSENHLRNIEEENFRDLPADVYVRGFVTAYAKTIGLDPTVVVPGYMARVEQSRASGGRGGFLGRS